MTARTLIVALMSALSLTGSATMIQTSPAAAAPISSVPAGTSSANLPSTVLRQLLATPSSSLAAHVGRARSASRSVAASPADRPSASELDKRIAGAARQLEVLVEQYNGSREDLRATKLSIATLGSRLGPLTRELEERQSLMDGLMANTYQRTRTGPTVALFASDQPHEFVDKLLVLHQLASEEQHAAEELRLARARLDETRAALNALAAQQRRQQTELNTRRATVKGEIVALKQMRAIAYGGGSRFPDTGDIPTPEYVSGAAGDVVAFAFAQLGKPYRWGAAGPRSYDCSGLTLAAWRTAGVGLPHNAASQYASTPHLSRAQLRPGDLVFFYSPISHVGVYIGGGKMIHAPEFGENVRVASIDSLPIHGYSRPG